MSVSWSSGRWVFEVCGVEGCDGEGSVVVECDGDVEPVWGEVCGDPGLGDIEGESASGGIAFSDGLALGNVGKFRS